MNTTTQKISWIEKTGYAFGDGAANIAWRAVATFLFIFYTDVFGLDPATVGMIMLIARFSDGVSDVLMGVIGDRTKSKYGHFRPWILWTAIPLAISLSLLFTTPGFGMTGKIVYAYITYILFTLIYTANNIPYGALMAVITPDNKERTTFGSFRMVGAFAGGMLVQGALLFLVSYFGNVDPQLSMQQTGDKQYYLEVSAPRKVDNVNIKTKKGVATFQWAQSCDSLMEQSGTNSKSFSMKAGEKYCFTISGEPELTAAEIVLVDQRNGYSKAIYSLAVFLAVFMMLTFFTTKERVKPPVGQKTNLWIDFKDLIANKPWVILLIVGLLFNVYNNIKQGIVVVYFTHYINQQLMAGTYLVIIMLASIAGAMATAPLGKKLGKRNLFIVALFFSAIVNSLLFLCGKDDLTEVFILGALSEFAAAIFPTLFFAMLGDAADYSEYKNGRRATGLVYSAGSFATKFGGGLAGAIIGFILGSYGYNGQDSTAIAGAIPGIKMLMSWVPSIIAVVAALVMFIYPLTQSKLDLITHELHNRREKVQENN
jgi:GPH family glycoside/pentoside/hexuronide:cation symporter